MQRVIIMSIRPIDISITIQQSTNMNRVQSGENVRPEVAHQEFADRLNREVTQQERQVNQPPKSENGRINPDAKGNNQQDRQRKKKGKKDSSDGNGEGVRQSGSMLDIRV